ncbi:MAG: polysaccharide deacetylase family protein [Variibacter sp.]|nr:polysaccharide deacetylase family protein [Variibacter sp.]
MLHSIVPDDRFRPDEQLRLPLHQLTAALSTLRTLGVEFIAMDDLAARLAGPASKPFAAFTFDDGYRDTLQLALPVMQEFGAPFTVYIPTGMITREVDAWWIGLAELILAQDAVDLPNLGRRYDCRGEAAKARAYTLISALIREQPRALKEVSAAIGAGGIDVAALVDAEALTAEDVRLLARQPGVTIGGHTVSHPHLARLPTEAARAEMADNKRFLEQITQQPVAHLAYPFGYEEACGAREAAIAQAVGFKTAVTTRRGSILAEHAAHLHALPREPLSREDTPASIHCKISGLYRAVYSRWGDPVAHM